jgi:dnd system-associated protein 4
MNKQYSVRRPKKYESLMKLLKDDKSSPFRTYASSMLFAAALGHRENRRLTVDDVCQDGIRLTIFNEVDEIPFMYSLAIAETNSVDMFKEEFFPEVMKIFEEYAMGGFEIIQDRLNEADIFSSLVMLVSDTPAEIDFI